MTERTDPAGMQDDATTIETFRARVAALYDDMQIWIANEDGLTSTLAPATVRESAGEYEIDRMLVSYAGCKVAEVVPIAARVVASAVSSGPWSRHKGAAGVRETSPSGMTNDHVAIDGPVSSGKTTNAQLLAAQTGHLYLDTGAMYRAIAYLALMNGVDLDNENALVAMLRHHTIAIVADPGTTAGYRVVIDGRDTVDRLFDPDVAAVVSTVAALPAIRAELVERQRAIASSGPVVMAGRDIGTVVLPDARFKFFLTASVDERARRRHAEFRERGIDVPFDEVRAQIVERDRLDSTRAVSPLRAAPDAITIDSTDLQPEQVVARMRAAMDAARA